MILGFFSEKTSIFVSHGVNWKRKIYFYSEKLNVRRDRERESKVR